MPAGVADAKVHLVRDAHSGGTLALGESEASAAPQPFINPRSSWGARPPKQAPDYASTVQVAIVHHTATSNAYSQSQVPQILQSIQAYHMDTNGWNDIGYNFLVDRFGGIWEGRGGGIDRPVTGAHTLGFNIDSTGVAIIGDFSGGPASGAGVDGTARIIAWKLGLSNVDPGGGAVLTSSDSGSRWAAGTPVGFNAISGHRDANYTDCPGNGLYNQLPALRDQARAYWAPILAYASGFRGGVFVAGAELTGDKRAEVITGADQGGGPQVRWFYGTGTPINGWFAYPTGFGGGVRVGRYRPAFSSSDNIITGPGPSGGPQVRLFRPDGTAVGGFFAYSSAFTGGIYVAGGNLDAVPGGDVVTGAGKGGGPQVRAFHSGSVIGSFWAYSTAFTGGVRVATGDVNGDGIDEIITGAGPGGGPQVRVFRLDGTPIGGFFAYSTAFTGGIYVSSVRSPDNKTDWIVTGAGEGGGTQVRIFKLNGTPVGGFFASNDTNGVRVGGASFDGTLPWQLAVSEGPGTVPAVSFRRVNGAVFFP